MARKRMPGSSLPTGLCHCGCGQPTNIAKMTNRKHGHVKGQPFRYVLGHSPRPRGADHGSWRGGRYMSHGYVKVLVPGHPRADVNGYVREHLLVAERALGRPVLPPHEVHHVNGDRAANHGRNLVLCEDRAYHMLLEYRARALAACGHADWIKCYHCKTHDAPENLYIVPGKPLRGLHRRCNAERAAARRLRVA